MITVTATGNDDTALLQEAFDDAGADPMRPQAVRPEGEFCITSQLNLLTNNLRIEGEHGGIEYRSSGAYAGSFKGVTRIYYDGPDTTTGYMLRYGDGTTFTRGHVLKDIVLDCGGKCNGVRADRCSNSRFEGVSVARSYSGWVTLESCYGLTWRDCDVYDAALVFMDLRQETHRANIECCTFNNMSTENGGTSLPAAVIRIGKGGTHSSNVRIVGCNFDAYRVPVFIDCLDAYALNVSSYMEGKDETLAAAVRLGRAGDPTKVVYGSKIDTCRMTRSVPGAVAAVDVLRVDGLVIDAPRISGFDQIANINHAACNSVSIHGVPAGVTAANPGPALVWAA